VEREQPQLELKRGACPYCKDPVRPGDQKAACDACMAWHHQECWSAHGGCSACGAAQGVGQAAPVPAAVRVAAPAADPPPQCAAAGCDRPVQQRVRVALSVNVVEEGTQHPIMALCHRHAGAGLRHSQSATGALGVLLMGVAGTCVILLVYTEETWIWVAAVTMSYVMGLAAFAQSGNRRKLLEQLRAEEEG